MSRDPYSPCLCGSGKKLKFCCLDIVPEMTRILKLIENQPDAAEKQLRSLLVRHKDKEVLVTQLASLIMQRNGYAEARELLVEFLRSHPDEPRVLMSLAELCLIADGFAASRRVIHRAIQLGAKTFPRGVAYLSAAIGLQMMRSNCFMSVREHLALAVRMSSGEARNNVLMQLAAIESRQSISYPLRGNFALLPVELEPELQKEELRARKVSLIGCWEPASILYTRLLEKHPQSGPLWHNLGLFQAWDGRPLEAAKSLHKAAELLSDYDTAVEAETLAQLLELDFSDDVFLEKRQVIPVQSVSELLTRLDQEPRLRRLTPPEQGEVDGRPIVAEYDLLADASADSSSSEELTLVIAEIYVLDSVDDNERPAEISVLCKSPDLDAAVQFVRNVAADLITPGHENDEPVVTDRLPAICRLFDTRFYLPPNQGTFQYRAHEARQQKRALEQWLETPSSLLGNMTPLQAAKDANNLVKVGANVLVLDAVLCRMGSCAQLSEIRSRLGVPAPSTLDLSPEQSVTSLPLLQLCRLNVKQLTDEQVIEFTNRMTLIRHIGLLKVAAEELACRPAAVKKFSAARINALLATIAREQNDMQKVSQYFAIAREALENDKDAFRLKLEIDIREFSYRLDNPLDPDLKPLLLSIRNRYFVKIPEIEEVLRQELEKSSCQHLLEVLDTAPVASETTGRLWTPGAAGSTASGGKLWVPGQD